MQKELRQELRLIEVTFTVSRGVVPGWRGGEGPTYIIVYGNLVQDVAGEALTRDLGVGRVGLSIWGQRRVRVRERRYCRCFQLFSVVWIEMRKLLDSILAWTPCFPSGLMLLTNIQKKLIPGFFHTSVKQWSYCFCDTNTQMPVHKALASLWERKKEIKHKNKSPDDQNKRLNVTGYIYWDIYVGAGAHFREKYDSLSLHLSDCGCCRVDTSYIAQAANIFILT